MTFKERSKFDLLINPGPKHLLVGYEGQRLFLLQQLTQQKPCPNCKEAVNLFQAQGLDIDEADLMGPVTNQPAHCPHCGRGLRYLLPWPTGDWRWDLEIESK